MRVAASAVAPCSERKDVAERVAQLDATPRHVEGDTLRERRARLAATARRRQHRRSPDKGDVVFGLAHGDASQPLQHRIQQIFPTAAC